MSKEQRVDPQIHVGLLVDPAGFPLEIHMFAGNKAETTTIVPVVQAFQERHGITDMVVVADAGVLSAANLTALEDAGFKFIVGSRMAKHLTTCKNISIRKAAGSQTGRFCNQNASWAPANRAVNGE